MTTSGLYTQRLTQLLLALLALGVWVLVLRPYVPSALAGTKAPLAPQSATFDTLTVQRGAMRPADSQRQSYATTMWLASLSITPISRPTASECGSRRALTDRGGVLVSIF